MSATANSPLSSIVGRHPRGTGAGPGLLLLLGCLLFGCSSPPAQEAGQPNIILVITDDQGWAQLGSHGDEVLRTPNLDGLAAQSVELTRFYVAPVCAPTRASLMTGRYNYRTGVVDTYVGRAMMHSDEVTLAETLSDAGYRTGIFGKWHLGDNYPLRAMDQGFQESVVHKGGGIGQPSDPPETSYFDPILQHNGQAKPYSGYCTDIFFREALDFIEWNRENPFFVYIPTNAPHSPYDVPESYRQSYLEGRTGGQGRPDLRDDHQHRRQRGPAAPGAGAHGTGGEYNPHLHDRQRGHHPALHRRSSGPQGARSTREASGCPSCFAGRRASSRAPTTASPHTST